MKSSLRSGILMGLAVMNLSVLAACSQSSQTATQQSSDSVPAATANTENSPAAPEVTASSKTPTNTTQSDTPSNSGKPSNSTPNTNTATKPTNERISFAKGASSTVTENSVVRGEENSYLINAGKGQTMNMSITALEDNAVFTVTSPSGKVLASETISMSEALPETGDYKIAIIGTRGNASYKLTTEVISDKQQTSSKPTNERISFAKGASSAVVENAAVRGDRNTYLINAGKGQTMNISITAIEDNAVFDVIRPDGTILATEANSISETLPATGDYKIAVFSTRGNASYKMTVGVK